MRCVGWVEQRETQHSGLQVLGFTLFYPTYKMSLFVLAEKRVSDFIKFSFLNTVVDEEIEALPTDMRARLSRIAALIAAVGLENVREPHIKHIEGQLWELRIKGKDGISRAIYVTAKPKRLVQEVQE